MESPPPKIGSEAPPAAGNQADAPGVAVVDKPAHTPEASATDKKLEETKSLEKNRLAEGSQGRQMTARTPEPHAQCPLAVGAVIVVPALSGDPKQLQVQLHSKESTGQKFSHWGPTIASVLSVILTIVVWQNGKQLSERQVKLVEEQNLAALADMRTKFFDNLVAADENKRTLAEIGLAGYGEKAMPVVHLALGVEVGDIRESGVNVVHRLFQAETKPEGRKRILQKLTQEEFISPNKMLRLGVVQSLVKIEPLLEPHERQDVTHFLEENVKPENFCSDWEGRETVHAAATFFGDRNPDSVNYLLMAAGVPRCGNGWRQACLKLEAAARRFNSQQRDDLRTKLVKLKATVLENLRQNVSDEDLAAGLGLNLPTQNGRPMPLKFEVFKLDVEKQFDELLNSSR